ncbi:helix-turn-helix domain-containing protein [Streptomyces sp. NPDC047024]|uniref:MerR family transcriptional regulator n=1 Tax=Streptomyces sp. NPDC047024 TaxID=3155476 RepID=UPI00340CCBA1
MVDEALTSADDELSTTADDELLTIGAFAARSRLSPKALRLYDRRGLLAPAHVDDATGYRYYRAAQVERARLVGLLRRLDMPLARVAGVVQAEGLEAADRLDWYWAQVEARIAEQRALVAELRDRLCGGTAEMDARFTVETVDIPERAVLIESRRPLVEELPTWIPESLDRLEAVARECGGVAGDPFVVYHAEVPAGSEAGTEGPVEACVPVADEAAARAWAERHYDGPGTARVQVEPAGRLARTRIVGDRVTLALFVAAFEAVERWVEAAGLEIAGPGREVFFPERVTAGSQGPGCEVAYPVR